MKKNPAPKVQRTNPLQNAQKVPLNQMLSDLERASGLNRQQKMNTLVELSMGPKRSFGKDR